MDTQAPLTFADRFFGFVNPFPQDDPRHELWEINARYGVEEVARFTAELLKRRPVETVEPEEFLVWILDAIVERFDILAKRLLIFGDKSAQTVFVYEEFLAEYEKVFVACVPEKLPSGISRGLLLSELRLRFKERVAHWTAEALKAVRDSEKRKYASKAPPSPPDVGSKPTTSSRKKYPNGLAGLQAKYVDMSNYYALVDLTQRQRECFSLRKEYNLPLSEVAGRLRIDRKTADEHIHQAENKIKLQVEQRRDPSGRIKKAPITD